MSKIFDQKTINDTTTKDDKDSVIKLGAKYNLLKSQFDEFKLLNKICNNCVNDEKNKKHGVIKVGRDSLMSVNDN